MVAKDLRTRTNEHREVLVGAALAQGHDGDAGVCRPADLEHGAGIQPVEHREDGVAAGQPIEVLADHVVGPDADLVVRREHLGAELAERTEREVDEPTLRKVEGGSRQVDERCKGSAVRLAP